jgi:hypothetical protein
MIKISLGFREGQGFISSELQLNIDVRRQYCNRIAFARCNRASPIHGTDRLRSHGAMIK